MAFTDPFIRRPVLATVVSLLIVLLGFQAFSKLVIRQYPQMENALITVTTAYLGANAETIQGYITQPLQQSLASAEGIDYMTSSSQQNVSIIQIYARIGANSDRLFTELLSKASNIAMDDFAMLPVHFELSVWAMKNDIRYQGRPDQVTLAQFATLKK